MKQAFSFSGPPRLNGEIFVPGDKSITHRAVMFGAFAGGTSCIETSCLGRDNLATIRIMRQLGVQIGGELSASMHALACE
ncbi:MAG TPA: hypothetical protein PLP17_10560, partial [Oligoflexia bacterium]|nr:hypothetical protein [Oligoflexia bacterium]